MNGTASAMTSRRGRGNESVLLWQLCRRLDGARLRPDNRRTNERTARGINGQHGSSDDDWWPSSSPPPVRHCPPPPPPHPLPPLTSATGGRVVREQPRSSAPSACRPAISVLTAAVGAMQCECDRMSTTHGMRGSQMEARCEFQCHTNLPHLRLNDAALQPAPAGSRRLVTSSDWMGLLRRWLTQQSQGGVVCSCVALLESLPFDC